MFWWLPNSDFLLSPFIFFFLYNNVVLKKPCFTESWFFYCKKTFFFLPFIYSFICVNHQSHIACYLGGFGLFLSIFILIPNHARFGQWEFLHAGFSVLLACPHCLWILFTFWYKMFQAHLILCCNQPVSSPGSLDPFGGEWDLETNIWAAR